ncbi:MAG TPA: hypothetical protein VM755_19815 [Stellaceae bacterium]|nr:hypothetical protein [Stellaceae bacterium]
MVQQLAIVNASRVLTNDQVAAVLPALQKQIDRDFLPAWGSRATALQLITAELHQIPDGAWPIFLNRHSSDPGALGWHTDDGKLIYGRVFVGDCMRYGVSWTVDLGHEILETAGDPAVEHTFQMPDGRAAALEICDAVESDDQSYEIDGVRCTNFVLPAYFSSGPGPYDFRRHLDAPCPALTPGGYMSIYIPGEGWTQVEADRLDGLRSRRALMAGWRRRIRLGEREAAR